MHSGVRPANRAINTGNVKSQERIMRSTLVAVLGCLIVWASPILADDQRPSVVDNVRAEGISGPAIIVSWNQGRDNVGVDGYNIYRDGGYYKTVGKTTNYIDKEVSANREYRYSVVAFDSARNYSTNSGTANAQSGDSKASSTPTSSSTPSSSSGKPSPPDGVKATVQSSSSVKLSWNAPSGGAEGYNIYKDGSYYSTVKGRTEQTVSSLSSNRSYAFQLVAFRNDQYSTKSSSVSVQTNGGSTASEPSSPDESSPPPPTASDKPAPPGGLKGSAQSSSSINLTWNAPSGGAEGYNIYKDGSYYKTVKGSTNYTAGSLSSGRSYSFQLVAFRNDRYSTKSSSISVATSGSSGNSSPPPPSNDTGNSAVPSGYKLVFNDEFDRSSVDSSKWNTRYRWGPNWIINNEQQYYVDVLNDRNFGVTPIKLDGSRLTIEATKTPSQLRDEARGQAYLSGAMTTHSKFKMKYGYVEMRAKLPKGKGLWPAFWLLHDGNDGNRPEIDVMEMLGDNTSRIYQTYHYYDNSNLRSTPSYQASGPDYSADFHTFGMLWEQGRITWYVDGKQTNRYDSSNVSNENMYLLMNLALGGSWAGSPNSSTQFPARFEIDYVRAYQR